MKLGKHPRKHDSRTLLMSRYMDAPSVVLPIGLDWSALLDFPMFLNDEVGDCTCASSGHSIFCWCHNTSKPVNLTDADILKAYSAVSGYDPYRPETDKGAALLDVLNYRRKVGIGGHRISAYAALDIGQKSDADLVQQAKASIAWFGGLLLGIMLPQKALDKFEVGGDVWDDPSGVLIGGHAILAAGYNPDGLWFETWARHCFMTWDFWLKCCDEAYDVKSDDWMMATGIAPNGFDQNQLDQDLSEIAAL